ncbi:hypothetical protein SLS60_011390 [Paraconiothyrium brasiliense]|uniref:Uncharacterized protein n=1 Tax=Paraconiothyrium brasiliense TaxID=300254 RepID=A0ABR3QJI2_9PLEO
MRSFVFLALVGSSLAAPFHFEKYFNDKRHYPSLLPSKPYPSGGWPSYPTGSPVFPGPPETGLPTGFPSGTGVSSPVIPSISTPSIPDGTGLPTLPTPSGTGIPTPTDIYSILPYYPTPAVDRRGLEIDYKLAPRLADSGHGGHGKRPHPHRPHGTGYPYGTGRPSHSPFPTGTGGFESPTTIPTPPAY